MGLLTSSSKVYKSLNRLLFSKISEWSDLDGDGKRYASNENKNDCSE